MQGYLKPFLLASLVLAAGYAFWPLVVANLALIKHLLIEFKHYCRSNPCLSSFAFCSVLGIIIIAGLPFVTLMMLLAGLLYGFWQAAFIVTVSRLLAALIAFFIGRTLIQKPSGDEKPYIIRKFENHPNVGLFLARLSPLPDGIVNYTVAASPISHRDYLFVSLLGMIPITLCCVWLGHQLGTISHFIRWIK